MRKDEDSSCFHVSQETEKHVCVILTICFAACLRIKLFLGFWKYVFKLLCDDRHFFYLYIKFTWRGRQGYLLCRGFLLDSKLVCLRLKKTYRSDSHFLKAVSNLELLEFIQHGHEHLQFQLTSFWLEILFTQEKKSFLSAPISCKIN